jgi:hypothetical protein
MQSLCRDVVGRTEEAQFVAAVRNAQCDAKDAEPLRTVAQMPRFFAEVLVR